MHHATQAELEQYEELGFFLRERVFDEGELADIQEGVENVHKQVLEAAARPMHRQSIW